MLKDGIGTLYDPVEPWRKERKVIAHDLNRRFNALDENQVEERTAVLRELLGEVNEGVFFNGPITFHYGTHTKIGAHTFVNFNFTCQDDTFVTIGEHCDFGPNVTIVTPCHPMLQGEREALLCPDGSTKRLCYALPVTIGDGCWLCANVVVCPGVTIGEGCVIGAGSVVTRDIPPHSFAAGNPCRVIRTLSEADSLANRPEILGDCSVLE